MTWDRRGASRTSGRIESGRVTAQGSNDEVLDDEIEPAIATAEDAT